MRSRCVLLLLAAILAGTLPVRAVRAANHPVVAGYERFYTSKEAEAAVGGRLLLAELNCVSCHAAGEVTRKQAPVLDQVASRVRVAHLRQYLRDPQATKPGTTMPAPLVGAPDREAKIEALVHYLASSGVPRHERTSDKAIADGRDRYQKMGCVACHGTRDARGNPEKVLPSSVPLGELKTKYTIPSLTAFLANPREVRPSGRMPHLLTSQEARDVANYLLQGLTVNLTADRGAANYAYYEGDWGNLPDFSKLKPVATGLTQGFDLSAARRREHFAMRFEAFFKVDQENTYTFSLASDDGSRLYVDDKLVVDNDGVHATQSRQGKARLTRGIHKIVVEYFEASGEETLSVQVEAPGFGTANLGELVAASAEALTKKPVVRDGPDAIEIQPALVEQGRALFASAGCANCHQKKDERGEVTASLKAPALSELKGNGGCVAPEKTKGVPYYQLNETQRKSLVAALTKPAPEDKAPEAQIHRTLITFNCYACHARNEVGGPEATFNSLFQTTQPEMGDEARIPPLLDGVGTKIRPEYLRDLLDKGAHDRPYMLTHMPGFGEANVGHLVGLFAAVDRKPKYEVVKFDIPSGRVKSTGRELVGAGALGCIKCHTFAGRKAEGVQGIDLTIMTKKLQPEWFQAYVTNPSRFRPGTRMPSAFSDGKSTVAKILNGAANPQIEAMWQYLSDGASARLPAGMDGKSILLVPINSAIIYRNFIEGASSRGIAVGYPEKLNLAFDANGLRLALLWQGAFIDAGRHWTDRGVGFEGPAGDNVLSLPGGVPLAVLKQPTDLWPSAQPRDEGFRFQGYRTTADDRPTFLYSKDDWKIEDFPNPVKDREGVLRREITISSTRAADKLFYRALVASRIESVGNGEYRIDGNWRLKVSGESSVRESAGKKELLVPIRFSNGKATITLEYVW